MAVFSAHCIASGGRREAARSLQLFLRTYTAQRLQGKLIQSRQWAKSDVEPNSDGDSPDKSLPDSTGQEMRIAVLPSSSCTITIFGS